MRHRLIHCSALRAIGLLLVGSALSLAGELPRECVIIDDPLLGKTLGTVVGGRLTADGYQPGKGPGHVLYRLPRTVREGYAQFEFKGMDPAKVPADADHGFFAMYDGRGIDEPANYVEHFKSNFNRWNVHWRQNRGVIKSVISCPEPVMQRKEARRAIFENDQRDWSAEPNGKAFAFDPARWHRMRIEWRGRRFCVAIDHQEVWSATGPHDYAPIDHRIWLGCAPALVGDKIKYACTLEEVIYRNFKLVAYESDPATSPPRTQPVPPAKPVAPLLLSSNRPAADNADFVRFAAPWTSPFSPDPQYRHHLVNREGQRLFILGKTAWAYFACKDPSAYLDRARAQGITVIRVALEGRPYWDQLHMEMWPWGGTRQSPDFASFNAAYWDEVERRIRLAGEKGIGIDLCLYFTMKPAEADIEKHRPYWKQAIARLGKYSNILTWEIHNEYLRNEKFQDAAGAFFHQNDPHRRPVCTSDGTTDDAAWPDRAWVDLAINHTCTSSTERHRLEDWYLALARNARSHGKPAWCNESGRENRHKNDDGVHRRKQGWLWNAAGCFWTHHSWDGCEGIDDPAYKAPGEEYLLPMSRFWQRLEFWRLHPNHTALVFGDGVVSAVLATPDRSAVVGYACTEKTGSQVSAARAQLRLPDGAYRITFINPANGQALETREHLSAGLHKSDALALPPFTDDLAVRIDMVKQAERTPVPGTR